MGELHRVRVPIRYGRFSKGRQSYTMVFSPTLDESRFGHAIAIQCKSQDIVEEAKCLWAAESKKGSDCGVSASWGCVGLLPNPDSTKLPSKQFNRWRNFVKECAERRSNYRALAAADAGIDEEGVLKIRCRMRDAGSTLPFDALRTDRSVLVMLDGSKALRAAVTAVFGRAAVVQRCQAHTTRNILDHLPERQRPWVQAILRRAYQSEDVKTAPRLLRNLARRLDREHPCAAASVREGLEETVTVLTLGLSPRLQRSLATTNAAESLISRTRHVKRNVKRWRGGQMMLRWVAAGVLKAAKGFRRLKGHADMPQLVAALRTRDQRLGFGDSREVEHVA